MLPFLAKNKDSGGIAGLLVKNREPDENTQDSDDDTPEYNQEDCARDIMHALKTDDAELFASALNEFIQNSGQEPGGDEASSPSPHTYDAQNMKAGE
jgi:hypothetical protein